MRTTAELISAARRNVRLELAFYSRKCAEMAPAMREIAEHGKTKAERSLARRWLALEESERRAE